MPRKHLDTCEDEACRGCLPEEATEGQLCYSCHALLKDALNHVPGQVQLLRTMHEPSSQQSLTVETKTIHVGPRMSSDAPDYISPVPGGVSFAASEPLRLAALDVVRDLEDILSQWVERLCEDYRINQPPAKVTTDQRVDPRRKVWMPMTQDGPRSKYDPVTVHRDGREKMAGQYVWVDPPAVFEAATASAWLLANLTRLEHLEGIGDEMEALSATMGQAHSVAPWRQQATRLNGIACPSCRRVAMVLYGGMSDVTCQSCGKRYPWERYALWVRMYEFDREGTGADDADDGAGG